MSQFAQALKAHFNSLADEVFSGLESSEAAVFQLDAEDTQYVRFNAGRVRQNTAVEQMVVELQLQKDQRTIKRSWCLTGNAAADRATSLAELNRARADIDGLPIDTHQVEIANRGSSENDFEATAPSGSEMARAVMSSAEGLDLSGLLAAGPTIRANRNSRGQNHWFATQTFFVDYSLYDGQKAAKAVFSNRDWDLEAWKTNLADAKNQLSLLNRPLQDIKRGQYRTYLAPAAVSELAQMLGWGALSYSAYKHGRNPLRRLIDENHHLSPLLSLQENFALGLTPAFNSMGELSPQRLPLVTNGKLDTFLVSSRTAREYGVAGNGAVEGEHSRSLDIAPGKLEHHSVLKELGTGLYLSNLHYLNWSDMVTARVTGMTRYACFWVENGEIRGPIKDLRFDVSLYDILGDKLAAVTSFQELSPHTGTYQARALGGDRAPGFLIDGFNYTL